MTVTETPPYAEGAFRHEALLYAGLDEFTQSTAAFVRGGLEADEPVLVVVGAEKIDLLRSALGVDAARVEFADMADIGSNPARIIPAWYDFVAANAETGVRMRGVGEPIFPERSPEALVECQRHESLLNLAFADAKAWWLLCPYDTSALDQAVVDEAMASHPYVWADDVHSRSDLYRDLEAIAQPFDHELAEPTVDARDLPFGVGQLDAVRRAVAREGREHGLSRRRVADLILAVNEVATNSVRHGGGRGTLRTWREAEHLVFEVRDGGLLDKPLAGRRRPVAGQEGGFGMWLVYQLCDLVQVRSFPEGSVVRIHMAIA
jgi:anti-sigma regulatory factor (Ser/Thr protein kinase)